MWTIACQTSIIDNQTNQISLISVVEQIDFNMESNTEVKVETLPIVMDLVSMWQRSDLNEPEQSRARLLIQLPNAKSVPGFEYEIDLISNSRFRSIGRIGGLPFGSNGTYKFVVELFNETSQEWAVVSIYPIEVTATLTQRELP